MHVYILATVVAGALAIAYSSQPPFRGGRRLPLGLAGLAVFVLVGFREDVGADWSRYNDIFRYIASAGLFRSTVSTDIGFYLVNWLSARLSLDFYGVTAFCAGVLAWGLVSFSKQTPYPFVSLLIAMPHVVNVMAMDHIRQSTALGFALIAMSNMLRGGFFAYVMFMIVACTFHKSAVVLLVSGVVAFRRDKIWVSVGVLGFLVAFYYLVLSAAVGVYEGRYITSEYGARASFIRLLQNMPPAVLYILIFRELKLSAEVRRFWMLCAVSAPLLLIMLLIVPSSAAIDRLGKLIIPLQMFVYSYMLILVGGVWSRVLAVTGLCLYCIAYQAAWFYYSDIAREFWIPYRTVLF